MLQRPVKFTERRFRQHGLKDDNDGKQVIFSTDWVVSRIDRDAHFLVDWHGGNAVRFHAAAESFQIVETFIMSAGIPINCQNLQKTVHFLRL